MIIDLLNFFGTYPVLSIILIILFYLMLTFNINEIINRNLSDSQFIYFIIINALLLSTIINLFVSIILGIKFDN